MGSHLKQTLFSRILHVEIILACASICLTLNAGIRRDYVLPELTVKPVKADFLHVLALVRDKSIMFSYSDTVTLFREKIVDFAYPLKQETKQKGWKLPRVLKTNSYYRFTDPNGKDSVSNLFNQHFSWSDLIGLANEKIVPEVIRNSKNIKKANINSLSDCAEWNRCGDSLSLSADILANPAERDWIPTYGVFSLENVEIEKFILNADYAYSDDLIVGPKNIVKQTYSISTVGRGRRMFKFSGKDDPIFVTTDVEIFFVDKEYITAKELKRRSSKVLNGDEIDFDMFESIVPAPDEEMQQLKQRVLQIDHNKVRLNTEVDKLVKLKEYIRLTRKQKAMKILKSLFSH